MRFVSVVGTDSENEMDTFIETFDLDGFEHVDTPTGRIWQSFSITAQPSYVFVNDNGEIERQIGALEPDVLESKIEGLIAS